MIQYQCPRCRSHLRSPLNDAGKEVNCPQCETLMRVSQSFSPLLPAAAWISLVIPVVAVASLLLLGLSGNFVFLFLLLLMGCPLAGIGALIGLIGAVRHGARATAAVSAAGLILNGLVVIGFVLFIIWFLWSLRGLPMC